MYKNEEAVHVVANSVAAAVAAILAVGVFFISRMVLVMTVNQAIFFAGFISIGTVVPIGLNIKKFKAAAVVGIGLVLFFALVFSALAINYQVRGGSTFAATMLFTVVGGLMVGGILILSEFAKEYSGYWSMKWDQKVIFGIFLIEGVAIAAPIILFVKLSN